MRTLKITSFLVVLFIYNNLNAGCTAPSLFTNNSIGYYNGSTLPHQAVSVTESAFFSIYLQASNCSATLTKTRVFYNNILVDSFMNSVRTLSLTIPQKPGRYSISSIVYCTQTGIYNRNYIWSFDLYQKPIEIVNTIATGVHQIPKLNPDLLLYPNPATNNITLLNETEEIKKATIYNSSGQMVQSIDALSTKIEIPLENYPSGIYFINVATLSDKILIKKFIVQ